MNYGGDIGGPLLWTTVYLMSSLLLLISTTYIYLLILEVRLEKTIFTKKSTIFIWLILNSICWSIHFVLNRTGYSVSYSLATFFHMTGFVLVFDFFTKHVAILLHLLHVYSRFRWVLYGVGGILAVLLVLSASQQMADSEFGYWFDPFIMAERSLEFSLAVLYITQGIRVNQIVAKDFQSY
jgi:hypothetical protein